MNCPACGHENRGAARFCDECGERFQVACLGCGTELRAGAKFCDACGAATSAQQGAGRASPPAPTERLPADYTPKHLADKILQSKSVLEGERKQVTVMFADIKGSMRLAEKLGAEQWHTILDRYFAILTEGVHRFEGTVNQYTGDGIMALFGAPIAHEDHAQRACYAVLSMQKELQSWAREIKREHGVGVPTRLGLHSGEVVVGKIGDDLRMDYTAQGHTVGLAQRMESLAEANTCYLSEATAKLVSGYFELEDLGAFQVKGASEKVGVFELRGQGSLASRLDVSRSRGLSHFVGRDADMEALESALAQAETGSGQVVGIVAEAGTGKSRLCFEFLERCRTRGMQVLEGTAVAHGRNIPLLPILQAFRSYYGITERDDDRTVREKIAGRLLLLDPAFAEFLPVLFEFFGAPDPERPVPRMDPDAKQRQIFTVIRRVVQNVGPDDRLVMLIEDLHWMDAVSETYLHELVDAVAGSRFLLLVNFRPEYSAAWTSKSYYRQIPLAPLGPDAVRELLDALLGEDPSISGLAESIHERTGGNPFFTEEVVQSLIESGQLGGTKGSYRLLEPIENLKVPSSVQSLLASRMDKLAEHEKRVLQAAAVIGKEFSEPILLSATDQPAEEVREALRALKEAEFVYEQAMYPVVEYAFKHPLTQEVALGTQLQDRRRRTHAAVANAIEQASAERIEERSALLAHHWEEAGDAPAAARWHARAAAWAGMNDVSASLEHWRRALALAGSEQTQLAVNASSQILALGWRQGVSEEECERLFEEARALAERAGDLASLAELTANYGGFRGIALGLTRDYIRYELDAVRIADEAGDHALRCGTRSYLTYAYLHGGLVEPGLQVCDELERLLDGDPHCGADVAGFSPLVGVGHVRLGLLAYSGVLIDNRAALGAVRQAALDHGYPEMVVWIRWTQVTLAQALREIDGALVWARESREAAENRGNLSDVMSNLTLARAFHLEGNAEAQLSAASDTLRTIRRNRDARCAEPEALQLIAAAHLALGQLAEARRAAVEATRLGSERASYTYAISSYPTLARVQTAQGEPASEIARTLDHYAAVIELTGMHVYDRELEELRAMLPESAR